jgi:hypothetical protein
MNIAIGHAQSEYTFHVELFVAFHVEARQLVHGLCLGTGLIWYMTSS